MYVEYSCVNEPSSYHLGYFFAGQLFLHAASLGYCLAAMVIRMEDRDFDDLMVCLSLVYFALLFSYLPTVVFLILTHVYSQNINIWVLILYWFNQVAGLVLLFLATVIFIAFLPKINIKSLHSSERKRSDDDWYNRYSMNIIKKLLRNTLKPADVKIYLKKCGAYTYGTTMPLDDFMMAVLFYNYLIVYNPKQSPAPQSFTDINEIPVQPDKQACHRCKQELEFKTKVIGLPCCGRYSHASCARKDLYLWSRCLGCRNSVVDQILDSFFLKFQLSAPKSSDPQYQYLMNANDTL